jgi:autotransporter-associated beta strand protein
MNNRARNMSHQPRRRHESACVLEAAIVRIASMKPPIVSFAMVLTLSLVALRAVYADSATWSSNPTSGDWNTATNWMPPTVPHGTHDIATFGVSTVTEITQSTTTPLGGIQFEPGASSYNINVLTGNSFSLYDAGVTNQSGVTQSITSYSFLDFYNGSTAGDNVIYTNTTTENVTSFLRFHNDATAGSGTFINNPNEAFIAGSEMEFFDNASADSSDITANGVNGSPGSAGIFFFDDSTAAESTITLTNVGEASFYSPTGAANSTLISSFSQLYFLSNSTAGAATITCSDGTILSFSSDATAGTAAITCSSSTGYFQDSATAGAATITWSDGSTVFFDDHATAGAATFTADGSTLHFQAQSDGGTARIVLTNAGSLIVGDKPLVFNLGSLEGDGTATATINRVLVIGGNNLDATFSGNLVSTVEGDWLTKLGTGTWTLAGTGSYPGSTTVLAGALLVTSASTPTGSGPVKVNGGTLGGSGTIAGSVTIGTGSGTGAFLAPAYGGNKQLTLTIQGSLTFNSDATYTYTFKAKGSRSRIDKVIANGVTINSGATIALSGTAQGQLTQGMILTLIKNTAATPISGTFSNLPDGGIVTVNGNNLQASYSGGDGNDLTLTVVP